MIGISSFPIMNDSLHKHVMRKYDPKFGDYRVTGEIRYSLDVGSVPVIEFDRSFINAYGLLTHGRLWASMYNFENGAQRRRNQAFVSWYDPIANWVRRHGRRVKGIDGYVHPEAVEWFTSGGKLQM